MAYVPVNSGGSNTECDVKGVTDEGLISAADIARAAAVAAAVLQTANAIKIASLRKDIADRYQKMADDDHAYFTDTFMPCETKLVAEVCDDNYLLSDNTEQKKNISARAATSSKLINRGTSDPSIRCVSRFCTGKLKSNIKEAILKQAGAENAVRGLAIKFYEEDINAKEKVKWARRSAVLNLGRGIASDAVHYANFADATLATIGEQSAGAAEDAIQAATWLFNREPTVPIVRPSLDIQYSTVSQMQNYNMDAFTKINTIDLVDKISSVVKG